MKKITFVHKTSPGSSQIIWQVLSRVRLFCEKFGTDGDVESLTAQCIMSYGSDNPPIMMLALDDEGEVKAHLIAVIDDFFGSRTLCVLQFWKDNGTDIPADLRKEALHYLRVWGSHNGADKVKIFARNDQVAQLFEQRYGFTRDEKVQMISDYDSIEKLF